ncbi:MAG TPA: FAD-dependent oxidoreductase [Thermoanaerobaculia bacterium]|jgi:hypothetical protein
MADSSDVSRRRFLQKGALATVAASVGLAPIAALARPAARTKVLKAGHPTLDGRWIEPGEPGFAMAAWPNNSIYAGVFPGAIAMCKNRDDVQKCVRWAREEHKTFLIRSGGHNYAGFSTSPSSKSPMSFNAPDLLIDVKPMNKAYLSPTNPGVVIVEGGASNQDVANALRKLPYAVPSGRCPTVGTSGLVLGGGWGFSATHSGLTCDSLVATELVLADGTWKEISGEDDLFWAVRGGGGGNFGVHTSFAFKLHDVKEVVTTFNIVWEAGKQVPLLSKLQAIQNANACMISSRSKARPTSPGAFPKRDKLVVETLGLYWGKEKELREILAPVLSMQPTSVVEIYEMDYWRARDYLLTDDPIGMYKIKNRYVEKTLTDDALDKMLDHMAEWPGGSLRQDNMGILFAIGGMVKNVERDKTAYVHRNSNYIFEMETSWAPIDDEKVVAAQLDWLAKYFDEMQGFLQPESYVNFPDRDLEHWEYSYYGCNLNRLSGIKHKYDQDGVFKFAQSIPSGRTYPSCPPLGVTDPCP